MMKKRTYFRAFQEGSAERLAEALEAFFADSAFYVLTVDYVPPTGAGSWVAFACYGVLEISEEE